MKVQFEFQGYDWNYGVFQQLHFCDEYLTLRFFLLNSKAHARKSEIRLVFVLEFRVDSTKLLQLHPNRCYLGVRDHYKKLRFWLLHGHHKKPT